VLRAAHREGMTGIEHLQLMANDPDGLMSAIYAEEMHWGCAGIALAIAGSGLAASAIAVTGGAAALLRLGEDVLGEGRLSG